MPTPIRTCRSGFPAARNHFWNPSQKSPATPWEAEIDRLMISQQVTRDYAERKRMLDRVQALIAENLPMIPLVSPHLLAGARKDLGNFRPAVIEPYVLWNVEQLYWRARRRGTSVSQPAPEWSNTRIVSACLAGDERAWSALLDRYKNLIYSIPLRYGTPPQDAADIFQAVCLDLFNELPRLRDAEALQGWLIRVTTHKCYHWKRRMVAQESDLAEEEMEMLGSEHAMAPDVLAELEREQAVRQAIASLPPRCREMIEMLFFEHPPIPYQDVAQRLKLATGSIGFIRGRCLKRLKKILQEKGF